MFEHTDIDKYEYTDIPLGRNCLLKSEIFMEDFSISLSTMLQDQSVNPYEVGYGCWVAVKKINEHSIDLSWYPDTHSRFHEVSISIPKDKIKICVGCCQYDIKPHLFIDHDWLEHLYTREYSVFALVDAIGVKEAIRKNLLSKDKLITLRNRIDSIAEKNRDMSFISFADSLIIKSNWSVGYFHKGIKCSYNPESFIKIFKEIQSIYLDVLELDIYAVLTQGNNEYYEESLLHISDSKNHICLNSLGVPFAELLAIDTAAKKGLKSGVHPPSELYMDEQYYHSLYLEYSFRKNDKPKNTYKAIMKSGTSYYFYSSCNEILNNLKVESEKH